MNKAHNNTKTLERLHSVSRGGGPELTCECVVLAKEHLSALGYTDDSLEACHEAMLHKSPKQFFIDGSLPVFIFCA